MNDPVAVAARAAAQLLEAEAEAGPGLPAEVEAVLATRESPSAPPQYVDPVALASLIVAIASLAWTIYTNLRKRTAKPSAEVVARTVRVTRRSQGQADAPDHIIEVVITETIRAAAGQEHADEHQATTGVPGRGADRVSVWEWEEFAEAPPDGPSGSSWFGLPEDLLVSSDEEPPGGSHGGEPPMEPAGTRFPPVRYLTGDLPERAPVGRRISLLVQITLAEPDSTSAPLERLNVPAEGRDVTITVSAPSLVPMGDLELDLHVPATSDSEPIRFSFRTGKSGLHSVMVRAFAGGTFLGELALQISVEVGAAMEEGPSRSSALAALAAEPGEVTLQVSRTDDDRYSFQLIAEALYPVELTKRLAGDPTDVVKAIVDELRAMAACESPFTTRELVRNRIKNLGAQLWAEAVPQAIRQQFWDQADRIKLFTVASDRDAVPWELLYPVDGDNDNGFLVEQFPVVRRVYGQGRVRRLSLASAAYVVPPGSPSNAMDEVAAVRAQLGGGVSDQGIVGRLDSVITLLDNPPNVLHFSCHNQFTDQRGSVIKLDGGPLRPSDLAVAVQTHALARACPLVFFNACRTAGEVPGLIQMIGWAKPFMGAGAGAFLGTLWAVRSSSARTFADVFYRALVTERAPLGAASLQARRAIAEDNGDPTWLAYTVYGNPSAIVEDRTSI